MLKLMYITNDPAVAKIADETGVDRIWIDLEVNGKEERQKNLDTVKSKHEITDIGKVKKVLNKAELIVRVNPIYENSKNEIDSVIEQGADIIMLPYFKTVDEVKQFLNIVNKRCKTMLLLETPEAAEVVDNILKLKGIDEIHIGLNDLHLGYKKDFMFELLIDGTVEKLCGKFKNVGIPYGFGGIARVGEGMLPAENIIIEHYRLGSTIAILSRSFCNTDKIKDETKIREIFRQGINDIRLKEKETTEFSNEQFENNRKIIKERVQKIVDNIKGER